jgi:very-short-patch-repair endonuclease
MNRKIERARDLRRDSSLPEKICWELIRAHRMEGIKFRRQHPIGPYFADFVCVSRMLVIEIDGRQHDDRIEIDARRTAVMEKLGWRVLRIGASEVLGNSDGVWSAIEQALKACVAPSPRLSP